MRARFNGFTETPKSSFLSCEKDTETILKRLFVDSRPYSDILKRLLIINNKDCLSTNINYQQKIDKYSLSRMYEEGYIRLSPNLDLGENEDLKSYIIITFDNFSPSGNLEFRDCVIMIDVICNTECWELNDFKLRPIQIVGYIDGILNNLQLSGIGHINFVGCNELILSEDLSGYCLMYIATHGTDDLIPGEEEEVFSLE